MEEQRFDDLARLVASKTSRRQVLKVLTGAAVGGLFASRLDPAVAAPKCFPSGHHCHKSSQCCSGLTCTNGTCAASCPQGCTTLANGTSACSCSVAADCSCGSQFCGTAIEGGLFVGGVCSVLGTSTGSCLSSTDCPAGYYCNGSGNCLQACGC